jgi:hypothetical protein
MKVDKQLISLITRIAGQIEITENGKEIIHKLGLLTRKALQYNRLH